MVTLYCDSCGDGTDLALRPDDIPAAGLFCPVCGVRVPPNKILTDADLAPALPPGDVDHDPEDWLAAAAERVARHPFNPRNVSNY